MERVDLDKPCFAVMNTSRTDTAFYTTDHPHNLIGCVPGRVSARQHRVRLDGVRWVINGRAMLDSNGKLHKV